MAVQDSPFAPLPLQAALVGVDVLALIADSVICTDIDGRIMLFNRAAEQSFGYRADEVIGQHVEMLLPQSYRADHIHQVRRFALGEGATSRFMGHRREVWSRRKNGEEFPAEATISRHSVDGRTILTVVHRDITERKELEKQHEAIEHELDHRIKNMFSVVSSIVSLSAKTATSVDDFRRSLQDRLRALAATQNFLRRGARGKIGLRELFLAELAHYRSPDETNIVISCDQVVLCPNAAQTLALALHELATNSAKYGAFSDMRGCVAVTSKSIDKGDERLLSIEWLETGGPPVKPPLRKGFGTKLIEQVIKSTFRADVLLDYRPEGLVCRMVLPRAAVEIPEARALCLSSETS
ncbi:MAG: PAS domain S-box protein [Hoeflea sp.]|uniref:PAS domain S-box protein n=1 Tax=Hoeflea sp. TaxID=1940281 RepID=UPI001DF48EF6|nr:PAS domain S-box protein [Hoeflea sp.]MBU4527082.1 PAS domain S-box protein [Alphaproteobacteria bacterium]MBU4547041.1 PAS domain S-box protein [Alphaproteobacteria bacterium]MBU4553335.1 PAS domain S-box protein [Alphaproteobacteria bacterium]MBV1721819.1 PAS domain S-box protein [Hoeflea sp.]MBV1783204.1 PAS domain S-box protein [Hoeflea sp.]